MKLFLIRHGETVDNIAGNLAGVTDSALTNYGVDQTKQLGRYFATTNILFSHIFASPLSRASRTAQAIIDAQPKSSGKACIAIVHVPDLIEQDFGSNEGKPFGSRSSPSKTKGRPQPGDADFVEAETKDAMGKRSDNFIVEHLLPVVDSCPDAIIAIVAHGMLLSTLWRRILLRISRKSLSIASVVTAARGPLILEHLGGWSNTGYLELHLTRLETIIALPTAEAGSTEKVAVSSAPAKEHALVVPVTVDIGEPQIEELVSNQTDRAAAWSSTSQAPPPSPTVNGNHDNAREKPRTDFAGYSVIIAAVDSRTHLVGLKRQRGGIGRLAHDESQSKLTSFFKKPRTS